MTDLSNNEVSGSCEIGGSRGNATYTCDFSFAGLDARIQRIEILRDGEVVSDETVTQCEVD
ncbi:hypothetical protein [Thioalkalivibrio sp. ALE23]|uniref:hypothetical protein n=1 Tax=Thioalkalivibrio sp. ALE23 TaxID=1265495 RepID=UPI0003652299|nr:hypothetical protein [Thioalkalivibrio sp. ALE23]